MGIDKAVLENLWKEYPQGCRVELVRMDDPYRKLNPGEQGTVAGVDEIECSLNFCERAEKTFKDGGRAMEWCLKRAGEYYLGN